MMQFTENPTSLFLQQNPLISPNQRTRMIRGSTWPSFATITPSKSSVTSNLTGDANCMEQLLIHCAEAIDKNDSTPAHQILWVLNNIAPPDGDSNQRLTRAFLRALILRASRSSPLSNLLNNNYLSDAGNNNGKGNKITLLDLANFVHLTPWYRFGFTAANSIILDAIQSNNNMNVVHIVDISITQCMQMPTLIDSISTRFEQAGRSPPVVRLTVGVITEQVPPMFDVISYDDVGLRLINFARSRGVVFEFKAVHTTPLDGFASLVDDVRHNNLRRPQEMLVVNCQMTLHYLQQYDNEIINGNVMSMRTIFLKEMRGLEPDIVVIVEEDADFSSRSLVGRLKSAFGYFWIPFDTVDTFLPKGSKEREWYEGEICWKIENVIAHEGSQRVERQEPRGRWVQRMTEAGFRTVGFGEEAAAEVKGVVEEHAVGWGSKKEEDHHLVLTWKGHNVAFASAWITF